MAFATTHSETEPNEVQSFVETMNAFSRKGLSVDHADDDEESDVEGTLESVANALKVKIGSFDDTQKEQLVVPLEALLDWMTIELPKSREVLEVFIDIGEAVAPKNAAFKLRRAQLFINEPALSEDLKAAEPERKQDAQTILSTRSEDFPPEIRHQFAEIQERLKIMSYDGAANPAANTRPGKSARNKASSIEKTAATPAEIEVFEHPREEIFELGYELYTLPSTESHKIRSAPGKSSVVVAGQVIAGGVRFFVSDWSLERFRSGHNDGSYLKAIESRSSTVQEQYRDLKMLPQIEEKSFVRGYQIYDSPSKGSHLVKPHETGSCRVAAYLDTDEGRFYLSDYSLERYKKHLSFWWIREID